MRRIPREELLRFLAEYDLPLSRIDILTTPSEESGANPILPIAGQDGLLTAGETNPINGGDAPTQLAE